MTGSAKSDDLFRQAMRAWETAAEAGVKMQEECATWVRQMFCESSTLSEWYEKGRKTMSETLAKSQENVDEAIRLMNQQAEASLKLIQKALEVRDTERRPMARRSSPTGGRLRWRRCAPTIRPCSRPTAGSSAPGRKWPARSTARPPRPWPTWPRRLRSRPSTWPPPRSSGSRRWPLRPPATAPDGGRPWVSQGGTSRATRLVREFGPQRIELLRRRARRQREFDARQRPDFLPETEDVRRADWTVAPIPHDLQDRRVEITGPTDREDAGLHRGRNPPRRRGRRGARRRRPKVERPAARSNVTSLGPVNARSPFHVRRISGNRRQDLRGRSAERQTASQSPRRPPQGPGPRRARGQENQVRQHLRRFRADVSGGPIHQEQR